jgi:MFS family permease
VDRVGEIRAMLTGAIVSLGAMFIFLLTTTWLELIPAMIGYRIGFALMNPAMLAWVGRMAPSGRRAEYMGFFSLINSTLWSAGPFVGALALTAGGSTGLFLMAAAATAVSIAAIPLLYRSEVFRPKPKPVDPAAA